MIDWGKWEFQTYSSFKQNYCDPLLQRHRRAIYKNKVHSATLYSANFKQEKHFAVILVKLFTFE